VPIPPIYTANESKVLVNTIPVEGVRSLEYAHRQARESLYAMGSAERIAVVSGASVVEGRLRVLSTSPTLDALDAGASFDVSAQLVHGLNTYTVNFAECYLDDKSLELSVGGQAEAVYSFTATRMTEKAERRQVPS
jgi:hypothetical protein